MGEMVLALWQQAYINITEVISMPKTRSSVAAAKTATTKSANVAANRYAHLDQYVEICYVGNAVTICKVRSPNGAPKTVRTETDEVPQAISSWRIVWGPDVEQRVTIPAACAIKTVGEIFYIAQKKAGIQIPRGQDTVIYCN